MDSRTIRRRRPGGLFVQVLDNAPCVLMAKAAGFDFFDGEHGDIDLNGLSTLMLLGKSVDMPSLVRVPQLARADLSRPLDLGATGIMVPMVEAVAQARQTIEWAKYPPLGRRSYSGGAHTGYGSSGNHAAVMKKANASVPAIAQIETVEGVRNVDEIFSVDGVDASSSVLATWQSRWAGRTRSAATRRYCWSTPSARRVRGTERASGSSAAAL